MGNNPGQPVTNPILSPGLSTRNPDDRPGTITVTGNFQIYHGELHMVIAGPNADQYDRLLVPNGYAELSGGKIVANLEDAYAAIPADHVFTFITRDDKAGNTDFANVNKLGLCNTPTWTYIGTNTSTTIALQAPATGVPEKKAKMTGILWHGDDAAGVFDPNADTLLVGATVRLFDETGTTQLASTTTDANGAYEFDDLDAGVYVLAVDRPNGERFTNIDTDSVIDPLTGRATIGVYDDLTNVSAGFYDDAAPLGADDLVKAHKNTAVTGNVLGNDTDADSDVLTVAVATGPAHGTLSLNPDGSFTYTPNTDYTGTDSFTYTVSDGYDGTDTATVSITVANTPAPVGANDSYTVASDLYADDASGVLANDTNPNNGTLTAILASGPAHGTLELYDDGSFYYVPDDGYTGTDSFTYRPSDADGPGTLATVSIAVTDHTPVATDDTATTNEDTAVTISVLTNDTDSDNDTLTVLGASDGAFGTTTVNANGTITYTPGANFNGTDVFFYVIDDGHGRLSYATATVTVNPVNDAPDATDDGTYGTLQNQAMFIPVLINDTDVDGDSLVVTGVTQGAHGTVTFNGSGVTYTPNTGYTGTDSFTYTVSDGYGGTDTATVSVVVLAQAGAGGQLWMDFDHDGIQDAGEPLYFGNVTVYLYDSNNNVVAMTTASGGSYSFTGLAAGDYRVRVTIPSGMTVSPQNQGSNDAIDNDFDLNGYSAVFTLTSGGSIDLDIGWY